MDGLYVIFVIAGLIVNLLEGKTQLWCEGPIPTNLAERTELSWRTNSCVEGNWQDCEPIAPSYCHVLYTDVHSCAPICKNGSWSTEAKSCYCFPGYTGKICDTEINECESFPCQNGGSCHDEVDKYTCTCPIQYTSDNCEAIGKRWKNSGNTWYYFGVDNGTCTKNDCRRHCQQMGAGVDLLLIESDTEQNFITSTIYQQNYALMPPQFWLNMQEITGTLPGTWIDATGMKLHYSNWNDIEPDRHTERCAVSWWPFGWADVHCNDHYSYKCKVARY